MSIKFILSLVTVLTLVIPAVTVDAQVIFSEDFSGTSADINGTTPDVTTGGAAWVASSNFNQDGSINLGAGSMTLGFTPVNGVIYTLDASLTGVTASSGNKDWFALGFVEGQSSASGTGNRFVSGDTVGKAWMLMRGDTTAAVNMTHINGTSSAADWLALSDLTGSVYMRIVLDTIGGSGNWAATWYAKRPTDSVYSEVRATTVLPNQTINSVGMALANSGVNGTIVSFSLTDNLNVTDPEIDIGSDWITWSGKPVTLNDVEVTNNDPVAGGLSLEWTADSPAGVSVGFSATDVSDTTVTIINDAGAANPTTVTLTLTVTQEGKSPVMSSMEIDVYDTSCDAGKAVGTVTLDAADFNADCITDFQDLAVMAASWLENYQAYGPAEK